MTSHHAITAPRPWWAAGDGGHLDNFAVATNARGQGIGQLLVRTLLQAVVQDEPAMVTLTTSIPGFFSSFGFQAFGQLSDGFIAMTLLLPSLALSEPCAP